MEGVRQLVRLRVLHALGVHGDGLHHLGLLRLVGDHVSGLGDDLVHHVHAVDDHAEGGVLPVQMGSVLMHDEELAAGRVHSLGPGHAENAPGVAQVVGHAVGGELALDAVAGAAHAGAVGAAALDHEAIDAAVENQPVIEAGVGQGDEIPHRLRCNIGIQLGGDFLAVLHFDGYNGIAHGYAPFLPVFLADGPLHFALGVALGDGVPLVIGLFALAQAQLHLHTAVLEIQAQGDQGIAVLLLQIVELADLPLVHQQPLGPVRVLVEDVALLIGGDVHAVGVDLAVLGHAVGILQVHPALPDGLDLRSGQLDARLVSVLHEIVVVGLAVLGRDLDTPLFHGGPPLFWLVNQYTTLFRKLQPPGSPHSSRPYFSLMRSSFSSIGSAAIHRKNTVAAAWTQSTGKPVT